MYNRSIADETAPNLAGDRLMHIIDSTLPLLTVPHEMIRKFELRSLTE